MSSSSGWETKPKYDLSQAIFEFDAIAGAVYESGDGQTYYFPLHTMPKCYVVDAYAISRKDWRRGKRVLHCEPGPYPIQTSKFARFAGFIDQDTASNSLQDLVQYMPIFNPN
jgi:hypothetical protein